MSDSLFDNGLCKCCGRTSMCQWGNCDRPADEILHAVRPCGHHSVFITSCHSCTLQYVIIRDGEAENASPCDECGVYSKVQVHVKD